MRTLPVTLVVSVLFLAGAAAAGTGPHRLATTTVTQIPFSDWLAAQNGNVVGFQARTSSTPFAPLGNVGFVDYPGTLASGKNLSYGFSATGSVTLTTFEDGTGEVLVNEDFSNAIDFANNASGVRIFGYSAAELAATPSDTPALASGHLQAKYTVPDASHAELNLFNVTFLGAGTLTSLLFTSSATGPLRAGFGVPEGTPGISVEADTGIFGTNGGGATADGFPAEKVDGRALAATTSASAARSGGATTGDAGATGSWGRLKTLYR